MSIKPDIKNWPIETEIIFEGGVHGILKPAEPGQVQREGKSLWLIDKDKIEAWWAHKYLTDMSQPNYEVKEIIFPKGTIKMNLSMNTKQGELLVMNTTSGMVNFDPSRNGITKEEAYEFARNIVKLADSLPDKPKEPELEYLEIEEVDNYFQYRDNFLSAYYIASLAICHSGFVGYANAEKELLNIKHFDADTCRFVVIKKA